MDTTEFCALTEDAVAKLLAERAAATTGKPSRERRVVPRWPFPGTVELWIPDESGEEEYRLTTGLDLSHNGMGILSDVELEIGIELGIAVHQPELSLHGRATVRHCTEIEAGYYIGVQFKYGVG